MDIIQEHKKLKELVEQTGLTQLEFAKKSDLKSASNVNQYLSGNRSLGLKTALKFAKGLGVPVESFSPRLARELAKTNLAANGVAPVSVVGKTIPLIRNLKMTDNGQIDLSKSAGWFQTSSEVTDTSFAFVVTDNSMEPVFKSGDIVVIEPSVLPKPSNFVLALFNDSFYLRQYKQKTLNTFILTPLNDAYPTISQNDGSIKIIGVVKEHTSILI